MSISILDCHETIVLISGVCVKWEIAFHYFIVWYLHYSGTRIYYLGCVSPNYLSGQKKQVHAKREPCGAGNCVCLSSKHCEKLGERKPVSVDSQALFPPSRERWQCDLTIHKRQQLWQMVEGGAGTWCWWWKPAAGRNSGVRSFHPVLGFSDQCAKRMENTPQWNCLDSVHPGSSTMRPRPTNSSELGPQEGVSLCLLDVPA